MCVGDCDHDDNCQDGLVCFHRSGDASAPPGCSGSMPSGMDYCWLPSPGAIGYNAYGYISGNNQDITRVIEATSNDIWGSNDSFFFSERTIGSNSYLADRFEIELYTENGFSASDSSLHPWAKFGLMVRDNLTPSSRHFSVFLTPTTGVIAQFRKHDGSGSESATGHKSSVRGGGWLKIEKNGDDFRASYKNDPINNDEKTFYNVIGEATIPMSGDVHVGVALSSHGPTRHQVEFDKFTLKVSH